MLFTNHIEILSNIGGSFGFSFKMCTFCAPSMFGLEDLNDFCKNATIFNAFIIFNNDM